MEDCGKFWDSQTSCWTWKQCRLRYIFQTQMQLCGSSTSRAFLRGVRPCQGSGQGPLPLTPLIISGHFWHSSRSVHATVFPHYWLSRILALHMTLLDKNYIFHFPLHPGCQMTKFWLMKWSNWGEVSLKLQSVVFFISFCLYWLRCRWGG